MEYARISFFTLLKKIFYKFFKCYQSISGKRDELHRKVDFQKNLKKSEKIRFWKKRGEISLRRLRSPT